MKNKKRDERIKWLDKRINTLRCELSNLEDKKYEEDEEPKLKALVGKCFKYRNSYGSGDAWWIYVEVVGHDGPHLIVNTCEKTCDKKIIIEFEQMLFGDHLIQIPCSRNEFKAGVKRIIKKLQEVV